MRKFGRLAIIGLCLGAAPAALAQTQLLCGLLKGAVVDGRDPDGRERLLVSIPSLGSAPVWAERVFHRKPLRAPAASAGDVVYVLFETCDPARPVVLGFGHP
jgi:hypothetical protein